MDLVCLQKLDLIEIYTGVDWRKKHKAPNEFGFALKVCVNNMFSEPNQTNLSYPEEWL